MASPGQLRWYAAHLLAWACQARQEGDDGFADRLAVRAAEYLDQAAAAETPVVQQQQQPQPEKK